LRFRGASFPYDPGFPHYAHENRDIYFLFAVSAIVVFLGIQLLGHMHFSLDDFLLLTTPLGVTYVVSSLLTSLYISLSAWSINLGVNLFPSFIFDALDFFLFLFFRDLDW